MTPEELNAYFREHKAALELATARLEQSQITTLEYLDRLRRIIYRETATNRIWPDHSKGLE